jgi:hypothetical protein
MKTQIQHRLPKLSAQGFAILAALILATLLSHELFAQQNKQNASSTTFPQGNASIVESLSIESVVDKLKAAYAPVTEGDAVISKTAIGLLDDPFQTTKQTVMRVEGDYVWVLSEKYLGNPCSKKQTSYTAQARESFFSCDKLGKLKEREVEARLLSDFKEKLKEQSFKNSNESESAKAYLMDNGMILFESGPDRNKEEKTLQYSEVRFNPSQATPLNHGVDRIVVRMINEEESEIKPWAIYSIYMRSTKANPSDYRAISLEDLEFYKESKTEESTYVGLQQSEKEELLRRWGLK